MDLAPIIARLVAGGGSLTEEEAAALGAALAATVPASAPISHSSTIGAQIKPAAILCPLQLSALLALLSRSDEAAAARGDTSPEGGSYTSASLVGLARSLRKAALVPDCGQPLPDALVDIVGTGGDGSSSVNISTGAAILASSAGAAIAKHGSIGASSRSGAADALAALGVPHLPPAAAGACLVTQRLAFLFAPLYHPALAAAAPVRRALRCRTLFNLLGPLLNPTGARRLVLGVYAPRLLPVYADAAAALGAEHALIVHCALPDGGGLDELAPAGVCSVIEVRAGLSPHAAYALDAAAWNGAGALPRCTAADLEGGGPADNAALLRHVLAGEAAWDDAAAVAALPRVGSPPRAPNVTAMAHAVALNAGACLYVAGLTPSLQAGCADALTALRAGAGAAKLSSWRAAAQALAVSEHPLP